MLRKLVHLTCASLLTVLLPAATGFAQTFDVSGGYAFRHEDELDVKKGWYGAAGFNFNDSLGLFGQISQHKATVDVPSGVGVVPVDVTLTIFGGGPRYSGNQRGTVTYFVGALFGLAGTKSTVGSTSVTSDKMFAFQPAVGVDVKAGGTVGVRFEFAPTYIKPETDTGSEKPWAYHFMVGVVVRGG